MDRISNWIVFGNRRGNGALNARRFLTACDSVDRSQSIIKRDKNLFTCGVFWRLSQVLKEREKHVLVVSVVAENAKNLGFDLKAFSKSALQPLCRTEAPELALGHDTDPRTQSLALFHRMSGEDDASSAATAPTGHHVTNDTP